MDRHGLQLDMSGGSKCSFYMKRILRWKENQNFKGLNLLLYDVFLLHAPHSADEIRFITKISPGYQPQRCFILSSPPNMSFLSLHYFIICLLSLRIILPGFALTCYAVTHLGPTRVPLIHHPLTSLHSFPSVTQALLHSFLNLSLTDFLARKASELWKQL